MATNRTPERTADETIAVVLHWQKHPNDAAAFAELLQHSNHLVIRSAQRAARHRLPFDDAYQVAMLGLLLAARSYDRARGKFLSYATKVINFGVIDFVSRHTRSGVHIGNDHVRKAASQGIARAVAKLGLSPEIAAAVEAAITPPVQLDKTAPDGTTALDDVVDEQPDAEAQLIARENAEELAAAMKLLSKRERTIITAIYVEGDSVGRVAKKLRITRREVQATADRALSALRHVLTER